MKMRDLLETASSGGTSSGSVATVVSPMGSLIKRMPSEPNLFGYVEDESKTKKKKPKAG